MSLLIVETVCTETSASREAGRATLYSSNAHAARGALVLRACLKIGHVVSNGAEVVGANVTEVLVSDRQATPIVSSRALARQALESFGKSCAYVEQHYARATGVSAAFDWQN